MLAFADCPNRPAKEAEGQKEWSEAELNVFKELKRQRGR
jgi:hypothetical protein